MAGAEPLVGMDVVGDVVQASTALAGLILVYLGSIAASFGSFSVEQRHAVKQSHQRRAWLAFGALFIALVAAVLAVVARWLKWENCADAAVIFLFVAFGAGIVSALLTVMEVR